MYYIGPYKRNKAGAQKMLADYSLLKPIVGKKFELKGKKFVLLRHADYELGCYWIKNLCDQRDMAKCLDVCIRIDVYNGIYLFNVGVMGENDVIMSMEKYLNSNACIL